MNNMLARTCVGVSSLLGALSTTPVLAAHLHVAPDGVAKTCTAKSPCGSIQAAVDAASPGDTIHLAAGRYVENLTIPVNKARLTLRGVGEDRTRVVSAGGLATPKEAPAGVPADIVIDVLAPGVAIENLSIEHPAAAPTRRDIGVFVRPSADSVSLKKLALVRHRTGAALEPTDPGSRGILVLQAKGTTIAGNAISGNYEDAIHVPASETTIEKNRIDTARRIGVAIIQETTTSQSTRNVVSGNTITRSGGDGIQVQGDGNTITKNTVSGSGGAGIRLCGAEDCVPPGASAVANDNEVVKNTLWGNKGGDIVDHGAGNTIK